MSYRDRERFDNSRPDQYGQEHQGRRQYGQSGHDQQRGGWEQQHHGWQAGGEHQRGDWSGRDPASWRGREPNDWRGRESREDYPGRDSQDWQGRSSPFTHSAFGESEQPRYFGTGAQGHGGGPSDSPYFDEVGFNRGHYEEPLAHQQGRTQYRQGRQQRRYPLGPKGYTRSDERLREDISERLMQAYDIDSSEVSVQVLSGKVTLEGTVPNRYMKHAIEDIADCALGVQDVDNRIRVTSSANNPVASSTTGTARTTTATGVRRDS